MSRLVSFLLACCLAGVAHAEAPRVVLDIPADPHAPVIANARLGKQAYRLLVDTGASDLYLDRDQARRTLTALPPSTDPDERTATGLQGDIALEPYAAPATLALGGWTTDTGGQVHAVDMSHLRVLGVDGLIGTRYLSRLNWIWDNRARQLRGYGYGAADFDAARAGLQCVPLFSAEGIPQVVLDVKGDAAPFLVDTGDLNASGSLSAQDHEALDYRGAVIASAPSRALHLDPVSGADLGPLRMTQIGHVLLGTQRLDGLVLHESRADSRLGRAFFAKFERLALDFEGMRLCFSPRETLEPDDLGRY
ncbi:hypothetical protein ARC20_12265 [Stenotrophomonas panacihumi]|uniref:Peptidase A2 domain-containing protein n=1 Tax=Stenotrophomonas panacihumi TaxID=676599 RepID=A0A0R0A780_9GAMM|nr:aspartyl protease family protein [Stenotrophomonas panacihumi]KRG41003.1 hypothetical protein ARC20_12265 [Stenotrophomonas panacihumi]PTN53837.1 hypothetical protein C9J98_13620 [Stenotrophomonas panacihumi]